MKKKAQATINDVARLAGVSKKTVSRVINRSPLLNPETRERVEKLIAEIGYVPNPQARALALRRNFLIALIHDNPNPHTVLTAQHGVLEVLRDTEFELIVHPVDRGSSTMLDDIRRFVERQRPYGVLLLPPISENDGLAALCRQVGTRYVRMGSAVFDEPSHMVASNDREIVRKTIEFLIGKGHQRIALVAGPQGFRSAHERRAGYTDAFTEAGLTHDPQLIAQGAYTFESGMQAGAQLLDEDPRPTAIFCCNDVMAAGVVHQARLRGLDIPGDISIIGFDDTSIASYNWPPLTTVRWPVEAMARAAARKLIGEEENGAVAADFTSDTPPQDHLFASTLIHRASVRALDI